MKSWLISPRDPLIFRNGKPFTAAPGSRSETLPMPFPSTLAGAIRTMAGSDPATGRFKTDLIPELLEKKIRGPILVELDEKEQVIDHLLPAPADALLFKTKTSGQAHRYVLRPLEAQDALFNHPELKICGPSEIVKEKPDKKAPNFWRWAHYLAWLINPEDDKVEKSVFGIENLLEDSRTHVGIASDTQVALEGALFQTTGLAFDLIPRKDSDSYKLSKTMRFGLRVLTDADITEGVNHLGGERRITHWIDLNGTELPFRDCPKDIRDKILKEGYCRLILITPAYFKEGFLPTWLTENFNVTVEAVINERYGGVSGWDYHLRQPKPTKRLVPAGSVYFLKLPEHKNEREAFISGTWMNPVSDDEQMRRDGFGIALVGTWDGQTIKMKMEVKS
jgi:CRISPR-associated protein Cmr3